MLAHRIAHKVIAGTVLAMRVVVAVFVVAVIIIGVAIAVILFQLEQQRPEAWASAKRAEDEIHAALAPGFTNSQVTEYFDKVGAVYGEPQPVGRVHLDDLEGAVSWRMVATIDQRTIAPGPLIFGCNAEIIVGVYFDPADLVHSVSLSRRCL